jgi:hypothetical protein
LVAEAALSLAEGMGFLFEVDLPPISDKAAALIWEEWAGSAGSNSAAVAAQATPLLTKFRRPRSWTTKGSAAVAVGASEADFQRTQRRVEAGFELSDTQIARQGDR